MEFNMKSAFFRFLSVLLAGCTVLLFAPARLHGADPAPKADDAGWILPGTNAGTGWHLRLKDARAEAAKEDKPILILFTGPVKLIFLNF